MWYSFCQKANHITYRQFRSGVMNGYKEINTTYPRCLLLIPGGKGKENAKGLEMDNFIRGKFSEEALKILRKESRFGQALENHCLRLFRFFIAISEQRNVKLNEDLSLAACYLHDIGLCVSEDPKNQPQKFSDRNYLKRGVRFLSPVLDSWQLSEQERKIIEEQLLYNHSLRKLSKCTEEAELLRQAVGVEHSRGVLSHGLSRSICREVFKEFPRLNFNRVLLSFFRIALLTDTPFSLPGIVLPK